MPKRTHDKEEFEYFRNKLKKLERKFVKSRRRVRVIETSSSSSSSSSRDTSPAPQNQQGGPPKTQPDEATSPHLEHKLPTSPDSSDVDEPIATTSMSTEIPNTSALVVETTTNNSADDNDVPGISLPDDLLCVILGEDPSTNEEQGPDINKDLANRLRHLITTGLDSKQRKELITKYLVPANCVLIAAPALNQEIKAALIESLQKRDKYLEAKQKQLASAITCLASAMTDQLESKNIDQQLVKKLMDTTRLLCDLQHTDSKTRRTLALTNLKKEMKEHLLNTKVDKYLFGENLSETLKSAKAVNKSSTELRAKVQPKTIKKPMTQTKHKPQENNLNWKPPAPARRTPGPQWSQKPASHRSQPASSSKQSSPPRRTNRRR